MTATGRVALPATRPVAVRAVRLPLLQHHQRVRRELVLLVLVEVVHAAPLELALAEQLERLRLGEQFHIGEAEGRAHGAADALSLIHISEPTRLLSISYA